jgi:hypothetical protein
MTGGHSRGHILAAPGPTPRQPCGYAIRKFQDLMAFIRTAESIMITKDLFLAKDPNRIGA